MSATRTRSRNGDAPEQEVTQAPEQESAPVIDIAAAVVSEEIDKASKVYKPQCARAQMSDGRLASVVREVRADESLGEYLLSVVRINPRDKSESASLVSLDMLLKAKAALEAAGVKIV